MTRSFVAALALIAGAGCHRLSLRPGEYELSRVILYSDCIDGKVGAIESGTVRYLGGYLGPWRCSQDGDRIECVSAATTVQSDQCLVQSQRKISLLRHVEHETIVGRWIETRLAGPGCETVPCSLGGSLSIEPW